MLAVALHPSCYKAVTDYYTASPSCYKAVTRLILAVTRLCLTVALLKHHAASTRAQRRTLGAHGLKSAITVVQYCRAARAGNRRPKQCSTRAVKRIRWLAANLSWAVKSVASYPTSTRAQMRPEHTGSLRQGVAIRVFGTHSKLVNLQSASPSVQLPTVAYLCTDA